MMVPIAICLCFSDSVFNVAMVASSPGSGGRYHRPTRYGPLSAWTINHNRSASFNCQSMSPEQLSQAEQATNCISCGLAYSGFVDGKVSTLCADCTKKVTHLAALDKLDHCQICQSTCNLSLIGGTASTCHNCHDALWQCQAASCNLQRPLLADAPPCAGCECIIGQSNVMFFNDKSLSPYCHECNRTLQRIDSKNLLSIFLPEVCISEDAGTISQRIFLREGAHKLPLDNMRGCLAQFNKNVMGESIANIAIQLNRPQPSQRIGGLGHLNKNPTLASDDEKSNDNPLSSEGQGGLGHLNKNPILASDFEELIDQHNPGRSSTNSPKSQSEPKRQKTILQTPRSKSYFQTLTTPPPTLDCPLELVERPAFPATTHPCKPTPRRHASPATPATNLACATIQWFSLLVLRRTLHLLKPQRLHKKHHP